MTSIRDAMKHFKAYIPYIRDNGISEDILLQLISEHKSINREVVQLQKRYEASKDGVPILKRNPINYPMWQENERVRRIDNLVNNKLNNAFDAEIVDTKIGYFLGIPINYVVDTRKSTGIQSLADAMESTRTRENTPDKDGELGKKASITGYAARLIYWATENNELVIRYSNIDPEEVIFLAEETIAEPTFAIRYYNTSIILDSKGNKQNVLKVEFHDDQDTYYFQGNADGLELTDIKPHGFDYCPLIGLLNNDEYQGEASKILNLVDAYDRTFSDVNSEIEQNRLAYLILKNIGMDEEDIKELHKSGLFEMFGENVDIKYLTKEVNDSLVEHHMDRLEKNIAQFSKNVNFSDESFAGNLSGVAIKFKTMALEHKCIMSERKFTSMLQQQHKVMCSGWAKLGMCKPEDYLNIWFGYKRNLPQNYLDEAQTTALLKGQVSERTRLSLLSFIDDVDAEIEEMKRDQQEQEDIIQDHLGSLADNKGDGTDGGTQKI